MSCTMLSQDVYAIPFGQQGLLAGLGLEGSNITLIHPSQSASPTSSAFVGLRKIGTHWSAYGYLATQSAHDA